VNSKSLLTAFLPVILIGGLILASAMHFGTVQAASDIPKPSIPEFTLKFVDNSYDVPTTYSVDPYTGKNITHAGYRVENKSIEITVKNQPFTMYKLDNEQYANLFYNVSYRGHYGGGWEYFSWDRNKEWFITQSDSEYTVISFYHVPSEGVMDFRVQAQIGYFTYYYMPFKVYEFHGETSGWSETQTITIGESLTPTPSPETTPTPPNMGPTSPPNHEPLLPPEQLGIIVGVAIAVAVIGAGVSLLLYLIKRK
jgi:hypothetical protein